MPPQPVLFHIRPANKGLNVSEAPQSIDMKEATDLMNVRFEDGRILFRTGSSLKYKGLKEYTLWMDVVYSGATGSVLIAFTENSLYYNVSGVMNPVPIYDGNGSEVSYPQFTLDPRDQYISIDAGFGAFHFNEDGDAGDFANNGDLFPVLGPSQEMVVMSNGTTDGIYVIAYTNQATPVEAQNISVLPGAPSYGRAVAIYANRLMVCGTENNKSEIIWSAVQRFDHWDTAVYPDAGSTVLGSSPDWIQTAKKLGEYLIIYKERSIFIGRETYIADPPVRFDPAPGQGIGLAAPNSVGDLGNEHIFLGWDDVYTFSLQRLENIGTRIKNELFYGDDGIIPKYLGNCTGVIAEEFSEYWLFVPTGKWPETDSGERIQNLVSNPNFQDGTSDWSFSASGADSSNFTTASNGVIGTENAKLEGTGISGSDFVRIASATYDEGESIDGNTYSIIVWLKASSNGATVGIGIRTRDSNGTSVNFYERNLGEITDDSEYVRYVFSVQISDSTPDTSEQIEGWIKILEGADTSPEILIDAVHLVRVDNVDSAYIDSSSGYEDIAYIGWDNLPQAIPFLQTSVGAYIPDTCWVFNYEEEAWSKWRLPMTGFGYDTLSEVTSIGGLVGPISEQTWRYDEKLLTEFAPTNLIGSVDGQIYEISKEYTTDWQGTNNLSFGGYWESKDFDLDKPVIDKTLQRLVIFHDTSHPATEVQVEASTDSGETWQSQTVTIRSGFTSTFADFFMTGPQVRFRVTSTTPGYLILGFAPKIIPRGETNPY